MDRRRHPTTPQPDGRRRTDQVGSRDGSVTKRQLLEQLRGTLLQERSSFEAHWRELADYMLPRRTRFQVSDRNKGDRRSQHIIDGTARFAARTLQSGLHAGLTSPARPWMRLTTPDPDLAEIAGVKRWLHLVTQRMLTVFLRSNLYNCLPTFYGDMGIFGSAAMSIVDDDQDLMRCYAYPIGSYAVGLDARGLASTFMRDYLYTVAQIVEEFGVVDATRPWEVDWTRLSPEVKQAYDKGNYEQTVELTWFVSKNPYHDRSKLGAEFLPYASCYFERGREDGRFLRQSGFHEFPVLFARWDVLPEDVYGTDSPAMTALGDVKALQIMHRRKAQAVDKGLNPPIIAPAHLRTQKTSLLPGDITYADMREGQQGMRPIHEVRLEGIQYMSADIAATQYRIQRAFYEDLFLMLAASDRSRGAQPVTAREIEERHEEKLLALGPVLERTNDELLDPMIDRVFAMLLRAGAIPAPPPELEGLDLKVEYLSLMSQAQKLVGAVGQDRFIQSAMAVAQVWPEVRHKVNVDQVMDDYGDMLGVNPKIVRTDEEAAEARQAEQQAVARQQEAERFARLGQGAKAMSDAATQQRAHGAALEDVLPEAA